jgi:cyclohexyl-isocyanide hydratase
MTDAPSDSEPNRRNILGGIGLGAALVAAQGCASPAGSTEPHMGPMHDMTPPAPAGGRPRVAMLVYPQMVLLDLVGPQTALKIAGCDIDLVGKDERPVMTDVGVATAPTTTFAKYAAMPDVLFVPGGIMGTVACMNDDATLDFVAAKGGSAKWVTSVCTGSLVLGAAGLLKGYRATSHWAVRDLLPIMGATMSADRVVEDRNRMTGGGVTAGIDFGLTLIERMIDRATAERVQLTIEYAPAPPLKAGTPEEAGPEMVSAMRARRAMMDMPARQAAERAAARLGI